VDLYKEIARKAKQESGLMKQAVQRLTEDDSFPEGVSRQILNNNNSSSLF